MEESTTEKGSEARGVFVSGMWIQIPTLLMASVGLLGNTTVLWLLGFRIRRNPFSVYILNLAAADFLFLCGVLAVCVEEFAGCLGCIAYTGMIAFTFVTYSVGLSLLTAISTERCLSALFPIWYRCQRPRPTSAAVCAVLWALEVLLAVAVHFICQNGLSHCRYANLFRISGFVSFSPVLCVSSLTLLLRVRCSSQRRQPPRLYGLVLLTVLVFLLCGLPLGVADTVNFFLESVPYEFPAFLACVNSSANPFIYFFLGSQRRKRGREPLRVVLQRALGDEQVLGDEGGSISHTNNPEMGP